MEPGATNKNVTSNELCVGKKDAKNESSKENPKLVNNSETKTENSVNPNNWAFKKITSFFPVLRWDKNSANANVPVVCQQSKTSSDHCKGNNSGDTAAPVSPELQKVKDCFPKITRKNYSEILNTALKTSLSEVLRKNIEANSQDGVLSNKRPLPLKDQLQQKSLFSASAQPSTFVSAVGRNNDTNASVSSSHVKQEVKQLDVFKDEDLYAYVPKVSDLPKASASAALSSWRSTVVPVKPSAEFAQSATFGQASKASCSESLNVDANSEVASIIPSEFKSTSVAHTSPEICAGTNTQAILSKQSPVTSEAQLISQTEKGAKQKKNKKRHFKGGTYGLYLSPVRKKRKKSQKRTSDSNSKDDELSLASTENGSYIDSEDGSSMFSEDFNTPSEKSLADDDGCSNSRCSPIFLPSEQRTIAEDFKIEHVIRSAVMSGENMTEIGVQHIPIKQEVPDFSESILPASSNAENIEKSDQNSEGMTSFQSKGSTSTNFCTDNIINVDSVPSGSMISSVGDQKFDDIDGEIMIASTVGACSSISTLVLNTEAKSETLSPRLEIKCEPKDPTPAVESQTCVPSTFTVKQEQRSVSGERNDSAKVIALSTIATSVKSRQRMKRRFTDDIIDTDVGILSLNSMSSCRKSKAEPPTPLQTSGEKHQVADKKQELLEKLFGKHDDLWAGSSALLLNIIENIKLNSNSEAKAGPITKIEAVYNPKQLPVSECTCHVVFFELTFSEPTTYYCQAVDSIDDKLVGCCNPVENFQFVSPSVRVSYNVMCEMHLWRHTHHHSCPRCGLFCSQGSFMCCSAKKSSSREVHLFHEQCGTNNNGKPMKCLHCEQMQDVKLVNLEMQMYTPPSFFLRQKSVHLSVKAKIGFPPMVRSGGSTCLDPTKTYTIVHKEKVLSSDGLLTEKDKHELEAMLVSLNEQNIDELPSYLEMDMYKAASECDVHRVLCILARGYNPDYKFPEFEANTALHIAAAAGSVLIVHVLVQAGAVLDPMNRNLRTPMILATENNNSEIVQYLVKRRICLNTRGESGMTCLHVAAREGYLQLCEIMIDSGKAKVNAQDDGGWTPIVWASEHGHADVVKYLLSKGGDPEIRDNEGNTALHWAAFSGNVEICMLCNEYGCNIDEVNEHGDTPLHIAARQDNFTCIDLFLSRNSNLEIRNRVDERPIDCCVSDEQSRARYAIRFSHLMRSVIALRGHRKERIIFKDIALGRERYPIRCINGVDDSDLNIKEFLYVTENCETCPIKVDRAITSLQHCECSGDCTASTCTCSALSFKCWYDKDGHLLPDFNMFDPPLLFECNRACLCNSNTCRNRIVQRGITSSRLELVRTAGKGWGVRTLKDIPKGAFICEYVGELITDSEADTRQDDSYLFDLDNKDGETYCLDARHFGNISRFINHLCEPNLVPVKVFIDHQDLSFPRIAFFSLRDILQYEELGFDYGEKFWVIKSKSFTCSCGSVKCKYSKDTIQETLANYNMRNKEEIHEEPNILSM